MNGKVPEGHHASVPASLAVFTGPGGTEAASWFSALVNIGALIGSLGGAYLREQVGLASVLRIASVLLGGGMAWVAAAHSVGQLCSARVFIGLGVGLQSVAAPASIALLAPQHLRGVLGTLNAAAILFGVLVAFVLGGLVFRAGQDREFCDWRVLAAFTSALAASLFAGSFFLQLRSEQACTSRQTPPSDSAFTRNELEEPLWKQLVQHRNLLLAGLIPMVWQQLSGINSVIFFGQNLLEGAGLKDSSLIGATVILVQLLGVAFIAVPLVERAGRRPLLIASALGMGIGAIALSLCLRFANGSWISVVPLYLYVLAFSVGLGPVPWLLLPELHLPARVRMTAASVATASNWACSFLVTGPPLQACVRRWSCSHFDLGS